MTNERKKVEHPSWCDPEACSAIEYHPTAEEWRELGDRGGEHASRELSLPGYKTLRVFLVQRIAPWGTGTFLVMQTEDREMSFSTQVGQGGIGFELYELLGKEVKDSVREWPTLYAERFPYVERALQDEADEATADVVTPRDPVELREQMTDEQLADEERAAKGCTHPPDQPCFGRPQIQPWGGSNKVTYDLTINATTHVTGGTLQEVRAAVAQLVTDRLAQAPERVATDAQTINMAFNTGAVEEQLDTEGDWYTVLDAYGEEPLRIRITKES